MGSITNCVSLVLLLAGFVCAVEDTTTIGLASLNGKNQYPTPVITPMTANFAISFQKADASSSNFTSAIFILDIEKGLNVIMAHIHLGNSTTNGPPGVLLAPPLPVDFVNLPQLNPPRNGTLKFQGEFLPIRFRGGPFAAFTMNDLYEVMLQGQTYVNVHTVEYPAGAVRGQIRIQGAPPQPNPSPAPAPSDPSPTPVPVPVPTPTPAPAPAPASSASSVMFLVTALLPLLL